MSFFGKLKDRLFRSSSKLDEGLDALVGAEAPSPPEKPRLLARLTRPGWWPPMLRSAQLAWRISTSAGNTVSPRRRLAATWFLLRGRSAAPASGRPPWQRWIAG